MPRALPSSNPRRKPDISSALRRRRALRVALGARRFRWRPLDRKGRIPFGIPRLCNSESACLRACHDWLLRFNRRSSAPVDSWWFLVEELAFDSTGKYSVVVRHFDQLVYLETLWTGYRPPFVTSNRMEVCCG